MGFTASCIESVAEKIGADYSATYRRMDSVGMVDGFIKLLGAETHFS